MLLLAVLCVAALFCPALSQPAKAGSGMDMNDYLAAALADANEWEGALESVMRNPSARPVGGGVSEFDGPFGYQLMQEYDAETEGKYDGDHPGEAAAEMRTEALRKREKFPAAFHRQSPARRQFVIDPIGGGYLLRRQSGPGLGRGGSPVKKFFPLDPIGGGYLLKRTSIAVDDATLQQETEGGDAPPTGDAKPIAEADAKGSRQGCPGAKRNSFAKGSRRSAIPLDPFLKDDWGGWKRKQSLGRNLKRSPGRKSDFVLRLVPKEEMMGTLTTDKSFLNNKDVHMFEIGVDSFPIDPIGGGFLLGRSVNYEDENSKSN